VSDERTTRELWDDEASTFDESADHGLLDPAVRSAWRTLLLEQLPPAPAKVADLGCGTGSLTVLLADEGYLVDGVDFSPGMVDRARVKAGDRQHVTITLADAADPPLQPGLYDVVLSRHVLWAMPDPAAALRRWARLLRAGGRLLLVEGHWHTGAGLRADQAAALVREIGRTCEVRPLPEEELWGRPVTDERYLLVSPG
jgi:ubiquinone/menaquinone biosynthesis C-methylase UbiE